MTIRSKMIIFFLGTFFITGIITLYITQTFFVKGFTELETMDVKEKSARVINVVKFEMATLESFANEWAQWDDTYEFMVDHNKQFIQRNLMDNTFVTQDIQMVLFVDLNGRLVFGKAYDNQNDMEVPVPNSIRKHITSTSVLMKFDKTSNSNQGILVLPEGVLMVVSKPIQDSEGVATARGVLVTGRYLNKQQLAKLSDVLQVSLSMYSFEDADGSEVLQGIKSALQIGEAVVVRPEDGETIAGYTMISDVYGDPAVLFKISLLRKIYQQGYSVTLYYLLALVISSLLIGSILLLLIEKAVLARLANLNSNVTKIGIEGNVYQRIRMAGKDELANVATAINNMLQRLAESQYALQQSQFRSRAIIEAIPDLLIKIDKNGTIIDYEVNKDNESWAHLSPGDIGANLHKVLPGYPKSLYKACKMGENQEYSGGAFEFTLHVKDKTYYREARCAKLGENEILLIIRDITGRKELEEQINYYSIHDVLTGLYNRAYFEEQLAILSQKEWLSKISIIMCDVDGLKLVNDTMGHDQGDALLKDVARIIKQSCSRAGVIARIGGDEFILLLQDSSYEETEKICLSIRELIQVHNESNINPLMNISLSLGAASNAELNLDLPELIKYADNAMYREKLHRKRSTRNSLIRMLEKTLEQRQFVVNGHTVRLVEFMMKFANECNVPPSSYNELELFAKFHDIGKVGIPNHIIFKKEALTPEERAMMQQHPEIGYRIAQASTELATIADWILKHHEWWDGHGYPLGVSGENIPIESRMLTLASAYDVMMYDDYYRLPLTKEEAINKIKSLAGSKFDPRLTDIFIKMISQAEGKEV